MKNEKRDKKKKQATLIVWSGNGAGRTEQIASMALIGTEYIQWYRGRVCMGNSEPDFRTGLQSWTAGGTGVGHGGKRGSSRGGGGFITWRYAVRSTLPIYLTLTQYS
ncbi:hypothetical protein IF1G_04729 [Cordyceps javanica]|uniref:Uncharacterized protein n=1 Tax=Cordyceps javanica TaxID=43265 RepID=A0A545V349_9HYPO|nr:hypothetical protein IF1G_04729 [Cordyceps javanica]